MKLTNETKIGIFISVVILLLAVLTVRTGNFNINKKGYELKVVFKNIDGISLNAPVMLHGLEVGFVKNILISEDNEDTKMDLIVWLEEKAHVREGAKAYVKNMGFMGEKYVGLTAGNKGGAVLPVGSVVMGQDPADLDQLLLDGQEIATNIKQASQNINERLQKNKEAIDETIANLHVTMKNMNSITTNVDERLHLNQQNIDDMLVNLKNTAVNLDQLTYDLKQHPWKIMYRSREQREESINALKNQAKP